MSHPPRPMSATQKPEAAQNGSQEAVATLAGALLEAQKQMPTIRRDAVNPHFESHYVTLDALLAAVRPILNEHGLLVTQYPSMAEGEPALTTRLLHAPSGEHYEATMLLFAPKSDPQGQGSAITYARRYSLMAMLGLAADEDDDGNRASDPDVRVAEPVPAAVVAKVTPKQIDKFIRPAQKRHKISNENLGVILYQRFGIERLEDLPRNKADALVESFGEPIPVQEALADTDLAPDTDGLEEPAGPPVEELA